MNRFAELLDRLTYESGRNNKLRLMTDYFRSTPDPERGWALAALTGALSFRHAKPGLVRNLIAERTDPVLFALSYDYVGDLSETVALMWPAPFPSPSRTRVFPGSAAVELPKSETSDLGVGEGREGGREVVRRPSTLAQNLPTPTPNPSPTSLHSGARERGLGGGGELSVGSLLALAYPERIAKNRGGAAGAFVLANGRGAQVDPASPLAREPYLAVAELAGSAAAEIGRAHV